MAKTADQPASDLDRELETIAKKVIEIPTLEVRGADRLDFHDLAVWTIKDALRAAYELGRNAR